MVETWIIVWYFITARGLVIIANIPEKTFPTEAACVALGNDRTPMVQLWRGEGYQVTYRCTKLTSV